MARVPQAFVRLLGGIPLFSGVSKKGLRAMLGVADEIEVKSGQVIVKEGGFDRDMYVIVSGSARVTKGGRKVGALGPGDFFGEMALMCRGARRATVVAEGDTRLLVLGHREFDVVVDAEPTVARAIMTKMAERLRNLERVAAD